jgi:hypothetical protein
MGREMHRPEMIQSAAQPDYVGALIEDERRMVLVSVDPADPWEAFRRLRRVMRRDPRKADARVDLFSAPHPLEHSADVIELHTRRRAG